MIVVLRITGLSLHTYIHTYIHTIMLCGSYRYVNLCEDTVVNNDVSCFLASIHNEDYV